MLKSTRSSIFLHLKRDKGPMKAVRKSPNTAERTAECSSQEQPAARQRGYVAEKRKKAFIPHALPTLYPKTQQPFGKIPDDFWMLFLMSFFKQLGSLAFAVRQMLSQVSGSPCILKQKLESSSWCMQFIPWDSEEL